MKKTTIAVALVVALAVPPPRSAVAGEPPVTAGQTQPPPPAGYTLTLNIQDIAYIGTVLRDRPYKEVAALLEVIQAQINAQRAAGTRGKDE